MIKKVKIRHGLNKELWIAQRSGRTRFPNVNTANPFKQLTIPSRNSWIIEPNVNNDPLCPRTENIHLLLRGRKYCTADLQFVCYINIINIFTCLVKSHPVKQEVSHTVMLPPTKWVFSAENNDWLPQGKRLKGTASQQPEQAWRDLRKMKLQKTEGGI